ncbi:tetratricopeptide repeat protein [Ulvibacter litoralis]|nr:tetratricopeptide repeat protein [Ulvibacter litoralis]
MKYTYYFLFFFGILLFPKQLGAQEIEGPTDDLGDVSDAFQESFFEALKQKGIENYELALVALEKAERAAKEDAKAKAVVYFEMGKNQAFLKKYKEAEESFKKVTATEGDKVEVLEALYDVYYQERDYDAAIPLVIKLIAVDDDYKEDLANLYSRTKQYDKAIEVLDDLDDSKGESDYRDALRKQIYRHTGNTAGQITKLESKIDTNPKKEQDYLNLIYLYSEEGNTQKAFETAKELLKNNPKSELAHLALYKFYLTEGDVENGLASMKKVMTSESVDKPSKYKVLGDFIQFVNANPQYENELTTIVTTFANDDNGAVYEKLGDYYVTKGRKDEALTLYEKGIALDSDNYSLLKNTLLLQIDLKKFESALTLSNSALEIFPAQPLIYLLNGVANNKLQNTDAAIESLETGIDYLLDTPKMERDFYEQLSVSYSLKGDTQKSNLYAKKALEVKDTN